jgi:hypothetical protein
VGGRLFSSQFFDVSAKMVSLGLPPWILVSLGSSDLFRNTFFSLFLLLSNRFLSRFVKTVSVQHQSSSELAQTFLGQQFRLVLVRGVGGVALKSVEIGRTLLAERGLVVRAVLGATRVGLVLAVRHVAVVVAEAFSESRGRAGLEALEG